MRVVVLAGGTGGAKLAAGLGDLIGEDLTVVANTGDDAELLGVHVSPDPDLCTYWLAGEIDAERGWGIAGDTDAVFERLVELGAPGWFALGDRDFATCLRRRTMLDTGVRQTEAQMQIADALGVASRVLPMCDAAVRTRVRTADGWLGLQEFLVRERAAAEIEGVEFAGIDAATPTLEIEEAIGAAEAIVVGPSNPVISIGPILAVPGMRALIAASPAPVLAVSPFVAGEVIKGPTDPFMRAVGSEPSVAGVASTYEGVIDALVVDAADPDPDPDGVACHRLDTLMDGPERRREVAAAVLDLCSGLTPR